MLLTGSIDGTAKVWSMEKDKTQNRENSQKEPQFALSDDRLRALFEGKKNANRKLIE